jgi:hypothetical protein
MKNSNWDLDFRTGLKGESEVADMLHLDTVEVKTDRRWKDTGNLYIETKCYNVTEGRMIDSGLMTTIATHWAFMLENAALIVSTYELKLAVSLFGKPIKCEIPPNPSSGYLITPMEILESIRQNTLARERAVDEFENHNSEIGDTFENNF